MSTSKTTPITNNNPVVTIMATTSAAPTPTTATFVINPDSATARKLVINTVEKVKPSPAVKVEVTKPTLTSVMPPPPPVVKVVGAPAILSQLPATKVANKAGGTTKKRILKYARPDQQKPKEVTATASTAVPVPSTIVVKTEILPPSLSPALLPPPPPVVVRPTITEVALSSIINSVAEGINRPKLKLIKKKKKKKVLDPTSGKQEDPTDIKITKVGQAVVIKNKIKEKKNLEREKFTIYRLYQDMKESDVISDRWCIPEPTWDPHTNREVLLCYEVDVLLDGSVRMKRCIKVLENFELIVLLDGTDKTHLFREKHPEIRSTQEMLDLIRKVTMVKVCSGIKDCDPTDFDNVTSKVIERGGSWYSVECNVEVERGCLGNICKKCTSLRNSLRRKMRRQFGLENNANNSSHPTSTTTTRTLLSSSLKPVSRTVGEALYINLQHMSGINKRSTLDENEFNFRPPRSHQVLHPEMKIYMNSDLKERLDELQANPPPPLTKIEHIIEYDPSTLTRTVKRVHTPIVPASFRNIITTSSSSTGRSAGSKRIKTEIHHPNQQGIVIGNSGGPVTLVQTASGETIQIPEGYMLADDSHQFGDSIVVQKIDPSQQDDSFYLGDDNNMLVGSNFTLEDGEEYEVIGEAASGEGDSIQVLPLATNSDIEIIEVDENMIQLVDEHSQPEIEPVDSNSDIFKFLQAHAQGRV